jgi:hypothetical protein
MTVSEAIVKLSQLEADGYGDIDMVAVDSRSGLTSSISIYPHVRYKNSDDNIGHLCDVENGTEYVPVHLDH